jgi:hypothetical protein
MKNRMKNPDALRGNHPDMLRGAFAGLVATIPMTTTMQALRAWMPRERIRPTPPREVIDRTVDKTFDKPDEGQTAVGETERKVLTTVVHFGVWSSVRCGVWRGRRRESEI